MTAADSFIQGKSVIYSGFDGKLYQAIFASGERNQIGVPSLTIKNSQNRIIKDVIMNEVSARSFFWNLDCTAED